MSGWGCTGALVSLHVKCARREGGIQVRACSRASPSRCPSERVGESVFGGAIAGQQATVAASPLSSSPRWCSIARDRSPSSHNSVTMLNTPPATNASKHRRMCGCLRPARSRASCSALVAAFSDAAPTNICLITRIGRDGDLMSTAIQQDPNAPEPRCCFTR